MRCHVLRTGVAAFRRIVRGAGSPSPQTSPACGKARGFARSRRAAAAAVARARYGGGVAVAHGLGIGSAIAADPPPAVTETPMRDPWVPPEARKPSTTPPARGAELRAQAERKLAASFDAADVDHTGTLTRAQAQAAGLGFIARHFDDIDVRRSGVIRFDDVARYLDQRRAAARTIQR